MLEHVLTRAADLLRLHHGRCLATGPAGNWTTLVRVVLEHGRPAKKSGDWLWLDEGPLRTAEQTAGQGLSRLVELLEENNQSAGKAGVLCGCALWWQRSFGAEDAPADFSRRSLESWQSELRAIRGISWELADRILLVVGGQAVYPLDRGSQRIAVRHGWVEPAADYDEWQAFFVRSLRDTDVSLPELAHWNVSVGRDYCRAEPQCDKCPLKSLLPERGPAALEGDE
jgi:endonuclease-3 related protein